MFIPITLRVCRHISSTGDVNVVSNIWPPMAWLRIMLLFFHHKRIYLDLREPLHYSIISFLSNWTYIYDIVWYLSHAIWPNYLRCSLNIQLTWWLQKLTMLNGEISFLHLQPRNRDSQKNNPLRFSKTTCIQTQTTVFHCIVPNHRANLPSNPTDPITIKQWIRNI